MTSLHAAVHKLTVEEATAVLIAYAKQVAPHVPAEQIGYRGADAHHNHGLLLDTIGMLACLIGPGEALELLAQLVEQVRRAAERAKSIVAALFPDLDLYSAAAELLSDAQVAAMLAAMCQAWTPGEDPSFLLVEDDAQANRRLLAETFAMNAAMGGVEAARIDFLFFAEQARGVTGRQLIGLATMANRPQAHVDETRQFGAIFLNL